MEKIRPGDIVIADEYKTTPTIGIVSDVGGDNYVTMLDFSGAIVCKGCCEVRKIDLSVVGDVTTAELEDGRYRVGVSTDDDEYAWATCAKNDKFNLLYGLCLAASRIKKPWPQKGDVVYHIIDNSRVDYYKWAGDSLDKAGLILGFVFKTREAAEAALEKIKAVFAANKEALERD